MAHENSSSNPPTVPADMLAEHRNMWHFFTRGMFWNAVATAVTLVFLLLIAKVF